MSQNLGLSPLAAPKSVNASSGIIFSPFGVVQLLVIQCDYNIVATNKLLCTIATVVRASLAMTNVNRRRSGSVSRRRL